MEPQPPSDRVPPSKIQPNSDEPSRFPDASGPAQAGIGPEGGEPAPFQPVSPLKRSHFLDILRGIAMLGILPVNIRFFAFAAQAAADPPPSSDGLGEQLAFYAVRTLMEYKFISTFALLFGAGLFLIQSRGEARGVSTRGVMIRRLLVLWGFGVMHVVFLWYGDILSFYGPIGLAVFLFWRASSKSQQIAALALITLPVLILAFGAFVLDQLGILAEIEAAGDGSPDEFGSSAHQAEVYRNGSFLEMVGMRLVFWLFMIFFGGIYFAPRLAGLMLLGMAWMQQGWFQDPEKYPRPFRRLLIGGLLIGAPLTGVSTYFSILDRGILSELFHYVGSLGLAAALVGAVGLVVATWPQSGFLKPFAAVGRMAFTNYIAQSLICSTLFYSYGFALFDELTHAQVFGVALAIWPCAMISSLIWLRFFRIGPLEWFWRLLAYGTVPQLRK